MFFDMEKRKWYEIYRGWFGIMRLKEIIYTSIVRVPIPGDFIWENGKLCKLELVEPQTPQPT